MFGLRYFRRYRMELPLADGWPPAALPDGYAAVPWADDRLDAHAAVKFRAFRGEIDAEVFPSLASEVGCRHLMTAIRERSGFLAGATWLIAHAGEPCGTIQGLRDKFGHGAIQNVGVLPDHRGRGLARALVALALRGFHAAGLRTAALEVTTANAAAVRLYRAIGFRAVKVVYKTVAPAVES